MSQRPPFTLLRRRRPSLQGHPVGEPPVRRASAPVHIRRPPAPQRPASRSEAPAPPGVGPVCPELHRTLAWIHADDPSDDPADAHTAHVAACSACTAVVDLHLDVLRLARATPACPELDRTLAWLHAEDPRDDHAAHVASCPACADVLVRHSEVVAVAAPILPALRDPRLHADRAWQPTAARGHTRPDHRAAPPGWLWAAAAVLLGVFGAAAWDRSTAPPVAMDGAAERIADADQGASTGVTPTAGPRVSSDGSAAARIADADHATPPSAAPVASLPVPPDARSAAAAVAAHPPPRAPASTVTHGAVGAGRADRVVADRRSAASRPRAVRAVGSVAGAPRRSAPHLAGAPPMRADPTPPSASLAVFTAAGAADPSRAGATLTLLDADPLDRQLEALRLDLRDLDPQPSWL